MTHTESGVSGSSTRWEKRIARKRDIKIEHGCEQMEKKKGACLRARETHTERKRDDKKSKCETPERPEGWGKKKAGTEKKRERASWEEEGGASSETEKKNGERDGQGDDGKVIGRAEEHKNWTVGQETISPVSLPVMVEERFQPSLATFQKLSSLWMSCDICPSSKSSVLVLHVSSSS